MAYSPTSIYSSNYGRFSPLLKQQTGNKYTYTTSGGTAPQRQEEIGLPLRSQSVSLSSSNSGLDSISKALADSQFSEGIGFAEGLRNRIQSLSDQRVGAINSSYANMLRQIGDLGGYDRNRINRDFAAQANSVAAQLAGTGLYNTTVQGNMRQGVERNRAEALGQLEEGLRGQNLQALMQQQQGVNQAQGDNMSLQASLGELIASLFARRAGTLPTVGGQTSQSESLSYA